MHSTLRLAALPLIVALPLLAACNKKPEPAAEQAAPAAPAAPSLATASRSVAYTCEKDLPITAVYGTNAEGKADVALVVQGQSFTLVEAVSASGARYVTAQGLEPGMGLVWWTKGDTAMLQQVPADRIDDLSAPQTIKTCTVKA